MKIPNTPLLPQDLPSLVRQLDTLHRQIATQVNLLSDGHISATNAATAAPTTGTWQQGDYIRNSEPVVAGVLGSHYVLIGWVCTASGEPGNWAGLRIPTGT